MDYEVASSTNSLSTHPAHLTLIHVRPRVLMPLILYSARGILSIRLATKRTPTFDVGELRFVVLLDRIRARTVRSSFQRRFVWYWFYLSHASQPKDMQMHNDIMFLSLLQLPRSRSM
jgi:hypothetical protein